MRLLEFIASVRRHWGALVTGGAVIGAIGIWQATGHTVPPWVYWAIALMALFVAFFKAWRDKAEQFDAERVKAERVVGSAEWLDLADRFKEISRFLGVQVHTASREGHEVDTWHFSGEVGESEKCKALWARAGIMLIKSPNVAKELSDDVLRATEGADRWCRFLRDSGAVRYDLGPGKEEYEGVVTLHYMGRITEVALVSSRLCIECSAKEL